MAFGNFLRGIYNAINPFDQGAGFADAYANDEEKRRRKAARQMGIATNNRNLIQRAAAQVNPFDRGATFSRPAPPKPRSGQVIDINVANKINNAKFGVLAKRPETREQFLQSIQPTQFNPVKAAPGAFVRAAKTPARIVAEMGQGTVRNLGNLGGQQLGNVQRNTQLDNASKTVRDLMALPQSERDRLRSDPAARLAIQKAGLNPDDLTDQSLNNQLQNIGKQDRSLTRDYEGQNPVSKAALGQKVESIGKRQQGVTKATGNRALGFAAPLLAIGADVIPGGGSVSKGAARALKKVKDVESVAEILTKRGIEVADDVGPILERIANTKNVKEIERYINDLNILGKGKRGGQVIEQIPTPPAPRPQKRPPVYAKVPEIPKPDIPTPRRLPTQLNEELSAAAQATRDRYKVSLPARFRNAVTRSYDPAAQAVRIDRATAKARGIKFRNLPANERLEAALDRTINSQSQADDILRTPTRTGESGVDLIKRYGEGTPQGKEFNNYTNAKFDLEFRAKHKGARIQKNISDEELEMFVRMYEAKDPEALRGLQTKKALSDQAVDLIADAGGLSRKDAEFIKNSYENAVPLSRVISEDLARADIGGNSKGSIARQSVVQKLVGNSDTPLDDSFAPLVNRITKATSQSNRARFAQKYLERVQEGTAPGELLVGAGNKAVRKGVRADNVEINQTIKNLNYKIRNVKDPTRKQELIAQRDALIEGKNINKQTIAQFGDDPTTGKQVISGLIDGEQFKVEVPPEIARMVQGLDEQKLNTLLKGSAAVNRTFQTAWTGFLQPIFALKSFLIYDPVASAIVSKEGFKTFRPGAVAQMFRSFKSSDEFANALKANGYMPSGGSLLARDPQLSAEKIAASRNVLKKIKYNVTHPKDMLDSLDVIGGKLANASRQRIAKAHYIAAKKAGASEADAIGEAVYAANNVLPNYQRTSNLLKQLNAVVPYSGASVAGTRSILRALRTDPKAWARAAALGVAPPIATVAYNMTSEAGENFYQDMISSGKEYVLDNNLVIVLPGAEKDPQTGAWTGVWKIPIAPELRALNKTMWRGTVEAITDTDTKFGPRTVATTMFDTMTGGLKDQRNPVADSAIIAGLGLDPRTGKPLVQGDMTLKDKKDQYFDTTSDAAKKVSGAFGNVISPIQADKLLGQFGLTGQVAQNRGGGGPLATLVNNAKSQFYGAFGEKEGSKFYKKFDEVLAKSNLDPDDRKVIAAKYSKDPNPGILDSVETATFYLNRPAVLEFDRQIDAWNRSQGKPGNPLFDLTPDQLQRVLVYRQAKMLNNGKQTYDKNGAPLFTALGLDEKWYQPFRDRESDFFTGVTRNRVQGIRKQLAVEKNPAKKTALEQQINKIKAGGADGERTFSGAERPRLSKAQQKIQDSYFAADKGQRKFILRANPWLLQYWDASDGFANKERAAIGLKPTTEDKNYKSGYKSYAKGGRRGGFSKLTKAQKDKLKKTKENKQLLALMGGDSIPSFRKGLQKANSVGGGVQFKVNLPKGTPAKSRVRINL